METNWRTCVSVCTWEFTCASVLLCVFYRSGHDEIFFTKNLTKDTSYRKALLGVNVS